MSDSTIPQPGFDGDAVTVGQLLQRITDIINPALGEDWDFSGLSVGDPAAVVRGVAVALDASIDGVRFAMEQGCNVLLTHHPVFLDPPRTFHPPGSGSSVSSSVVFEAISHGVALMNFHTCLDASPLVADMLLGPLGSCAIDVLERVGEPSLDAGYGRIGRLPCMSAQELAGRCNSSFGGNARVWDGGREISTLCAWTGSASDAPERCLARGVDALVCGEVKYHAALDGCGQGLTIIDLGHDVSEQPFVGVLSRIAQQVCNAPVVCLDPQENWTTCKEVEHDPDIR